MADENIKYNSVLVDIKQIIESGRKAAYGAVNSAMIMTYWNIGRRIVEDEQAGEIRAAYGTKLLKVLSEELTKEYGRGFHKEILRIYENFNFSFLIRIFCRRVCKILTGLTFVVFFVLMMKTPVFGI